MIFMELGWLETLWHQNQTWVLKQQTDAFLLNRSCNRPNLSQGQNIFDVLLSRNVNTNLRMVENLDLPLNWLNLFNVWVLNWFFRGRSGTFLPTSALMRDRTSMSPALLVYKQLWKCALKFIISSKNKENFVLMCHMSFLGTKRSMYITGLQCCHKHVSRKNRPLTFYHRIMISSQELFHLFSSILWMALYGLVVFYYVLLLSHGFLSRFLSVVRSRGAPPADV